MQFINPKCYKEVGENVECHSCNGDCIKYGRNKQGKQRYRCKVCKATFIVTYINRAYQPIISERIASLLKEGCGIRNIARLLKISAVTVLKRIQSIAQKLKKPVVVSCQTYELDELCTYIQQKTKQCWIIYALRRDTKEVVDFTVGSRSNATIKLVTDSLLSSNVKCIYTDKLLQYKTLLPMSVHRTSLHGTNHIERKNLTLRTHLKRLNRRTICFSKSIAILTACLKIYFWG